MLSNFKTWILGSGLLNEIINEYYDIALYEMENGATFSEIEAMLKTYQDAELYLECEGIKIALDYSKFWLLTIIVRMTNQKEINNIKIIDYGRNEKDSINY
tara:strand:+ start:103 stop:405 length:303 start_codon:yes stop_codon:yes gene_type:complete